MSSTIIDLDDLVPPDKTVVFDSQKYVVPGDMPLKTFLQMNLLSSQQDGGASQEELLGQMVSAIVDLFLWRVPEHDREARRTLLDTKLREMGMSTITKLLTKIYPPEETNDLDAEAAAAVDPPEAGTTTTSTE